MLVFMQDMPFGFVLCLIYFQAAVRRCQQRVLYTEWWIEKDNPLTWQIPDPTRMRLREQVLPSALPQRHPFFVCNFATPFNLLTECMCRLFQHFMPSVHIQHSREVRMQNTPSVGIWELAVRPLAPSVTTTFSSPA